MWFFRSRACWAAAALACCLWAQCLHAQEFYFRHYGDEDGLSNLAVLSVAQDAQGFIWASTETGLFRYDGKRFELMLDLAWGRRMTLAPDGNLWIASNRGLVRWDGSRFYRYERGLPPGKIAATDLSWDARNGRMIFATDKGLFQLDAWTASRVPGTPESNISAVHVAPDGSIWFGSGNKLVQIVRNGSTFQPPVEVPLGDKRLPKYWSAILTDPRGNLWARGQTKLYVREKGGMSFRLFSGTLEPATYDGVLQLSDRGEVLVPTNKGLGTIDPGTLAIRFLTKKNGLFLNEVSWFLKDRDGSAWLGILGGGVSRWKGYREWENWTPAEGLGSGTVWAIGEDRAGTVWAGTETGLSRLDRTSGQAQSWPVKDRVLAVEGDPENSIWLASSNDIYRFDPARETFRRFGAESGLPPGGAESLAIELTGKAQDEKRNFRVWVAMWGGLYIGAPRGNSWRFERVLLPGNPKSERISVIRRRSDGSALICSNRGLLVFREGRWTRFTKAEGLPSDELISAAFAPDGSIWAAYYDVGDLSRCTIRDGKILVERVPRDRTTQIYFVGADARGWMWLGTESGTDLWRDGRWTNYSRSDGLVWNDIDQNAFHTASDGAVWIGTGLGASRFEPSPVPVRPDAQQAVIQTLTLAGKTFPATAAISNASFSIAYKDRSPTIAFTAPIFKGEESVRFRYRLLHLESAWTETHERSARYTNLPAGNYTFEVEARNANQGWSPSPAQFIFRVATPWWQTWWFYTVCLIAAALSIRSFWRWRIRAMLARQQELEEAVHERTEELHKLAMHDALTGLLNRRAIMHRAERELAESAQAGIPMSLIMADIDHFKSINDRFGHQAGDAVLIEIARRMTSAVRRADPVGRYGGEEVMILLPNCGTEDALRIAEDVRRAICDAPVSLPERELRVTCSLGVTSSISGGWTLQELIEFADKALYEAKHSGRNRVSYGSSEALNIATHPMPAARMRS